MVAFDRTRATRVYGSSKAAFFQDGVYFDGDGKSISDELAAEANPEQLLPVQEPESTELPTATDATKKAKAKPVVLEATGIVEKPVENPSPANWKHEAELRKLSAAKLQGMVDELGGPTELGKGSKRRLVAYLLKHTT